jgi:hypothetical protein
MNNPVKNNIYSFVKCFWCYRNISHYIIYNIEDYDDYSDPEYIDMGED